MVLWVGTSLQNFKPHYNTTYMEKKETSTHQVQIAFIVGGQD